MKCTTELIGVSLVASWLCLASTSSVAAPRRTGIQGQATVCSPCGVFPGSSFPYPTAPVQTTVTIVLAQTGRPMAEVTTDANGYFQIALPPGRYVVVPSSPVWPSDPELVCALLAPTIAVTVGVKNFSVVAVSYVIHCEPAP